MTHLDKDSTMEERFDKQFPNLSLITINDLGGHDATPYVKDFIAQEKEISRREGEKSMLKKIFLEKPSEKIEKIVNDFYENNIFQPAPWNIKINAIIEYLDGVYIALHTPTQHVEESR
jgi:hypothetical protein